MQINNIETLVTKRGKIIIYCMTYIYTYIVTTGMKSVGSSASVPI